MLKRLLLHGARAMSLLACAAVAQPPDSTLPQASRDIASTDAQSAQAESDEGESTHAESPRSLSKKNDQPAEMAGIVVTARRREEILQQVPLAVTTLDAADLSSRGIYDLSALGAAVPNLTIYPARAFGNAVTAYIRGVGQSEPAWGVEPGVGIYVDDVYLARPQAALLDILDVERVEVLRGPQRTL